ncbi:MAG: hypothetical protein JWL61_1098 [Gemmatimonadetes bacterium]|nr:hypothetical protein [Gemmatimonadota bacterium]
MRRSTAETAPGRWPTSPGSAPYLLDGGEPRREFPRIGRNRPAPRTIARPVLVAKAYLDVMKRITLAGTAAAVLLFPLLASGQSGTTPAKKPAPADTAAHHHDMADMPGMSAPITVPKGALYTVADVQFMQGMIAHHGQAIYMSRLAAGRHASPRVLKFANKIDQSQAAEIRLMQEWLVANKQTAPTADSWRTMTMPGMLTPEQLKTLDAAQGTEFDRQFLNLMIQHHNGALRMVKDLFATPNAAQDIDVSVFANDVVVVQTAEIDIMNQMLANL